MKLNNLSKEKVFLPGVILLATLLRLLNFNSLSLWHDEAFSANLIRFSWGEMFERMALDVHPPLYYILLKLWAYPLGDGAASLRLFSVFFGVLTVIFGYMLVRTAFKSQRAGLIAAILLAVSPFQLQYASEVRMYTLGTALTMLSAYLLYQALQKKTWTYWISLGIVIGLMLNTHYYLLFTAIALGIFALLYFYKENKFKFKEYGKFFTSALIGITMFLPWLPTFIKQTKQVQQDYWIEGIKPWSIPQTNVNLLINQYVPANTLLGKAVLLLVLALSLYIIYFVYKKEKAEAKLLPLFAFSIPFILSIALSLKQSIYLDRYFIFAGLFLFIIIALWFRNLHDRKMAMYIFAVFVSISIFSWLSYWDKAAPTRNPGMQVAASHINKRAKETDTIIVSSNYQYFNFKYYNETKINPLLFTPGTNKKSDIAPYAGSSLLNDQDLLSSLQTKGAPGSTVWLVWTDLFGNQKPSIPSNWIQIDERGWSDTKPFKNQILITEFRVK